MRGHWKRSEARGACGADYSSNFNNSLTRARLARCDNFRLAFQLKLGRAWRGTESAAGRFLHWTGHCSIKGA
jgi:hypothetical protein